MPASERAVVAPLSVTTTPSRTRTESACAIPSPGVADGNRRTSNRVPNSRVTAPAAATATAFLRSGSLSR